MSSKKNLAFFEDITQNLNGKVIFIDIDGTLLPDSECCLGTGVIEAVSTLKKRNEVYLCTNSRNHTRNQKIERQLHLKIINLCHKKPSKKILCSIPFADDKKLVVIGDKYLTDARFAKNIGADLIMTKRKVSGRETLKIRLFNFIDDFIYYIVRFFSNITKLWSAKNI